MYVFSLTRFLYLVSQLSCLVVSVNCLMPIVTSFPTLKGKRFVLLLYPSKHCSQFIVLHPTKWYIVKFITSYNHLRTIKFGFEDHSRVTDLAILHFHGQLNSVSCHTNYVSPLCNECRYAKWFYKTFYYLKLFLCEFL